MKENNTYMDTDTNCTFVAIVTFGSPIKEAAVCALSAWPQEKLLNSTNNIGLYRMYFYSFSLLSSAWLLLLLPIAWDLQPILTLKQTALEYNIKLAWDATMLCCADKNIWREKYASTTNSMI